MKQLNLNPINLSLLQEGRSQELAFERKLKGMFDEYGFALLTGAHPELVQQTFDLKLLALPYFLSPRWEDEVLARWKLRKHGQLGPTDAYEEKHLNAETGDPVEEGDLKRYVSVDPAGNGWEGSDKVRSLIHQVIGRRFSIGLQVARAYENAHHLKPGTLAGLHSLGLDTHTTARLQWYPHDGYSKDHTDKCALTVLDFEPGLEIQYPKNGGGYVQLVGAKPGDLVINLGDTFSRMLHGDQTESTRHRVIVPEDCPPEGRVVFPLFIHAHAKACFPDGESIKAWCEAGWAKESHVRERN